MAETDSLSLLKVEELEMLAGIRDSYEKASHYLVAIGDLVALRELFLMRDHALRMRTLSYAEKEV